MPHPHPTSPPVVPTPTPTLDEVALRDGRGLHCLLADPNSREVLREDGPVVAARIATFAMVERARRNGDSPTLLGLAWGVSALAALDDVDGLRRLFAMIDTIKDLPPRYFEDDVAYRARVRLPIEQDARDGSLLAVVRETALGGDPRGAAAIYDREVKPSHIDSNYERRNNVAALAAIGRADAVRSVIDRAAANDRVDLAGTWTLVAIRKGDPVNETLAALIAAVNQQPTKAFTTLAILRAARLAGRSGDVAPLRRALVASLPFIRSEAGTLNRLYDEAVAVDDRAMRTALERLLPSDDAQQIATLRTAPFDRALAIAKNSRADLARLWRRWIAEGADPIVGKALDDAACAGIAPSPAMPTPPVRDVRLVVTERRVARQEECERFDTHLRLGTRDETLVGECVGACTKAEKREGRAELERIRRAIARGDASESELDYNFTECDYTGARPGRVDRVGDRDVALLVDHYLKPHGIPGIRFRIALEVCGDVFVSKEFGAEGIGSWSLDQVGVRESTDHREILVAGARDVWRGVLYRLTLPECPGKPVEDEVDSRS